MGLHRVPKDDSGFSHVVTVNKTPLTLPSEFLEALDLHLKVFLRKIDSAVSRFSAPVPHHTSPAPDQPFPQDLSISEFVFVQKDASAPYLY